MRFGTGWRPLEAALCAVVMLVGFSRAVMPAETAPETPATPLRRTPVVDVFQRCRDAVVAVTGPKASGSPGALEDFFDLPGKTPTENTLGAGFVVHRAGYVLTNAHSAERVVLPSVSLASGREYPAEIVAVLHDEDLALLKVEPDSPMPALRLAASGDLLIGEPVIVIGHPHGLRHTCTAGVLSATGRSSNVADVPGLLLRDLIQSDAGVNPGSSGGPWLNVLGEVIGMTISKQREADNIAFAVAAARLRQCLPRMLDVEYRQRLVTGLELAEDGQCRLKAVTSDSPAGTAGIEAGDVILRLADQPTPTVLDFHLALVDCQPGQTVSVELVRKGQARSVAMTLGQRPKPDAAALLREKLGLTAVPLDPEKAKQMLLRTARGVVITAIEPRLYAKLEHKPEPGDLLARIGPVRPRDLDHAGALLEKVKPGDRLPLVVLRHKQGVATRIDLNLVLPP